VTGAAPPRRDPSDDRLPIVFVDLDGTVLRSRAGRLAMLQAAEDVAGRPSDDGDRMTFTGRTDAWIAGELLRRAGHRADRAAVERVHRRYLELLAEGLPDRGCVAIPGALALAEALQAAARAGRCAPPLLLTGNLREGARLKLRAAGLLPSLPVEGGFGDLHEDRADVARTAAALAPHARPVVIGDAPADVYAARAIGAKAVLVATGPVTADVLATHAPDALLHTLEDLDAALAALLEP